MKRIALLGLAALAVIAAACSDSSSIPTSALTPNKPSLYGAGGGLDGTIYTTDRFVNGSCIAVNANIYGLKEDVYLYGGPNTPTLAVGDYYVQITSPDDQLLGTSVERDGNGV